MDRFSKILDSIANQTTPPKELLILSEVKGRVIDFELKDIKVSVIEGEYKSHSQWLNAAAEESSGDYILYINNLTSLVILKRSYIEAAMLAIERHPNLGMLYWDYELETNEVVKEIWLLKHHTGRVRDNQDCGKVFLFSKQALRDVNGFDETLKYKEFYDIRLKLSEKYEIVNIANKFAGSGYRVVAQEEKHNVFDYLVESKESQIEAEKVLTNHLKRINAYLPPGSFYKRRPIRDDYKLEASVIIPVNNRPEFVGTAIESVLNQTVQNVEAIVVVNGGFEDPTIEEVKKYIENGLKYDSSKPEVRLIVTDVNNIGLCLNLGVKSARGKYYVQLDSDDRLKANAVEKMLELFNSDDEIGIVIGSYEVWEKKSDGSFIRMEEIPVVTHSEWTEKNGRNNLLRVNGAGAPRSIPIDVIREVGYFSINDEPFARNYGEDYDMVLKISEKYQVGRIWEPIYEVVRHPGGTDHSIDKSTIDRNDEAKDYMRMEAIKRRIKLNETFIPNIRDEAPLISH
jgi:glycosyltransferase involved in cell wall biosynthesis